MFAYRLFLLAVGGAIGTVARYLIAAVAQRLAGGQFPAGTLAVNLLGCVAIGWLVGMMHAERIAVSHEVRLMLTVGVLGGLTTFSAFAWESVSLLQHGQWFRVAANVLLNNVAGLALALAGFKLGQAGAA